MYKVAFGILMSVVWWLLCKAVSDHDKLKKHLARHDIEDYHTALRYAKYDPW